MRPNIIDLHLPRTRDSNLGKLTPRRDLRSLKLLQRNGKSHPFPLHRFHTPTMSQSMILAHQVLITAPVVPQNLRFIWPVSTRTGNHTPCSIIASLETAATTTGFNVESLRRAAVFVFRLLVSAVLEQGAKNDGVGNKGREEDVDGGEEGAEGLGAAVVEDEGELVEGQEDGEDGKGESEDDEGFSLVTC